MSRDPRTLVWILAGAFALGCTPPPDAGRTRPEAVRTTPFAQQDVQLLGLRVRMIDEGARDAPVVVLIPGHTSRIEECDGLVPVLARRHRVLVLDFPGSGYAEKPDREYTLQFYEDIVLALLDTLGIERAHLAGGSQGGNLVLRLALRAPERFDRLLSWAPGAPGRRARASRA